MDINNFRLNNLKNIYAIGLQDDQITIHSQQTRAICLARLLTKEFEGSYSGRKSICIVGGGIAGLTCALELLQNGWYDITILERMPDLLAVQNGCDTRWVHPHIINWPDEGSEEERSNNGVLDWTASTASNVTYEIEKDWMQRVKELLRRPAKGRPDRVLSLHVGVTYIHAQILESEVDIEWIRDSSVRPLGFRGSKVCDSEKRKFEHVIFASGFGIEQESKHSYWRNEGHGQLHIDGLQRGYIVSGLGDGAISDLLRLTTKHFRPDRVILEMHQLQSLKGTLRIIKDKSKIKGFDLIGELLSASSRRGIEGCEWKDLIDNFGALKRGDTKVFLYHKSFEGFSAAFNASPASFFNKLMLFILYRKGAFQYVDGSVTDDINAFCVRNNIPGENIILRHGVDRGDIVARVLHQNPGEISFQLQPYEDCKKYIHLSMPKSGECREVECNCVA